MFYLCYHTHERGDFVTMEEIAKLERELKERSAKYWLYEEPETFELEHNVIRYYPKAERLSFHLPDFYSTRHYKTAVGKGVSIRLDELKDEPKILRRMIEILQSLLPQK